VLLHLVEHVLPRLSSLVLYASGCSVHHGLDSLVAV
jgi:hypothetical protein